MEKSYKASFKTKGKATGEVEAIVSVFSNVDLMGDRVMPGAFKANLAAWKESATLSRWCGRISGRTL